MIDCTCPSKCEYWDSGWCCHSEGPKFGCVGYDNCKIIATNYDKDSEDDSED